MSLLDTNAPTMYTPQQVEEIASCAARCAIEQFLHPPDLDSSISQNVVAENGGDTMASKHKERYYYTTPGGDVDVKVVYGRDKKDTDAKFQSFLMELAASQPKAPRLADFINNTYKPRFLKGLSPTTINSYNYYIDRFILPVLGDINLDRITVANVQAMYDYMAKEHIVADTITRVSGLLGRIFHIAIDMDLVEKSPIKKTLLINEGSASEHHKPLPDDEVARIKQLIPSLDEQQRLYMGLLVYTGMRREEICGLGWEHIHLAQRYGSVVRTVVYPDGKNTVVRNTTKTKASTREFIIPEPLAEILQRSEKSAGYIIHGRDPKAPASLSTVKRLYKKAFKILGITDYDNHDWRTTFGTQLKESGMTSAQVADLMGHADTRMVETTYAPSRHEGIMKHKDAVNAMSKIS